MRGGEPRWPLVPSSLDASSPHARGVNLYDIGRTGTDARLPRMRAGEPIVKAKSTADTESSPHTRGHAISGLMLMAFLDVSFR